MRQPKPQEILDFDTVKEVCLLSLFSFPFVLLFLFLLLLSNLAFVELLSQFSAACLFPASDYRSRHSLAVFHNTGPCCGAGCPARVCAPHRSTHFVAANTNSSMA